MYCRSSTYNDISCIAGFFYTSSPLLSSIFLPNPLDVKKEVHDDTDSNSRNLQASTMIDKWKKLKTRILSFPFCYPHVFPPSTLNHQELVIRRVMINPRTKAPIAICSVRRHQLIPLPRRMIRIPMPMRMTSVSNSHATTSRQDTKPRKSCFYNAVAAWGCMKRSELYGWLIFVTLLEGYEMCLWTWEVIPYTQARRSN